MYRHTHHKDGTRLEWADGGSYFSQTVLMIEVINIISEEIAAFRRAT